MKGIDVALSYLGKQEKRDRKELISLFKKYARKGDIVIDPATTPWCAAFVNACERSIGNTGTGKLNARSFLHYGTVVDPKNAKEGDIIIFKRGSSTWQGHVAYFVKYDKKSGTVVCLGGNQADMVCYSHYATDRILGIRRS
jgi:uncharacterized protein (TIGR02594 family)